MISKNLFNKISFLIFLSLIVGLYFYHSKKEKHFITCPKKYYFVKITNYKENYKGDKIADLQYGFKNKKLHKKAQMGFFFLEMEGKTQIKDGIYATCECIDYKPAFIDVSQAKLYKDVRLFYGDETFLDSVWSTERGILYYCHQYTEYDK